MTKILRSALLLILCLTISVSVFAGCSKKDNNDNISSKNQTSSDVTSEDEPSSEPEDVSSEETIEDDIWDDEYIEDDFDYGDEASDEEVFIGNATVKNGSSPVMTTL